MEIRIFILNGILPGERNVKLCFSMINKSKKLVLTLLDYFYLSNSLCNLISLVCLNNNIIFHNNKDANLYSIKTY